LQNRTRREKTAGVFLCVFPQKFPGEFSKKGFFFPAFYGILSSMGKDGLRRVFQQQH
jgi:hypothetical protein